MENEFVAHISEDGEREQTVLEHLMGVSKLCKDFVKGYDLEELVQLEGFLHDIGKYSAEFQNRIRFNGKRCDHSTAGTQYLYELNCAIGTLLGYAIAGHHAGLPDYGSVFDTADNNAGTLVGRLKKNKSEIPSYSGFQKDIDETRILESIEKATDEIKFSKYREDENCGFHYAFLIRFLYSCLVDADYIDTEKFMGGNEKERGIGCDFSLLLEKLNDKKRKFSSAERTVVNILRGRILEQCEERANCRRGIYKLNVPTGGGKTFASMAFALNHIKHHNSDEQCVHKFKHIIYVIPFTSIIEQNAKVFSEILGEKYILQHHSNFDFEEQEGGSCNIKKLATENWDYPITVTTNVQFFESLFAYRSSKCRKIHNIADSVIIFDEVQMFPSQFLLPCMRAIEELVKEYGCTTVLCSATQPGLERFIYDEALRPVSDLCTLNINELEQFNRTDIELVGELSQQELVEKVLENKQALIIVNTKRKAKQLFKKLEEAKLDYIYHLSTFMCPEHRHEIIEKVKKRLKKKLPCIVVSTSLIEAGVNLDFPVVYREMAGLDSIIQAAGRCNREGKLPDKGKVYVYEMQEEREGRYGSNPYYNYLNICRELTKMTFKTFKDLQSNEAVAFYFKELYKDDSSDELEKLDKSEILKDLNRDNGSKNHIFEYDFRKISKKFKMIDDLGECSVIVDYKGQATELINTMRFGGYSISTARQLQKYTVNVMPRCFNDLVRSGKVLEVGDSEYQEADASRSKGHRTIGILKESSENGDYSSKIGLIFNEDLGDGIFS